MTVRVYITENHDPWMNLAVEEYLLNNIHEDDYVLYLWQNENTVVIGKNQNPWSECRTSLLENDHGKLARRISGGGAVFHDLGNLNFTFLMGKKNYNLDKQFSVILKAVQSLGIDAEKSGRNDILFQGRKFSGNAFCFRKEAAYHHGTILVNADFEKLTKYLQVSEDKINAKGIKSVRARVINLSEVNPDITIEKVRNAVATAFTSIYGKPDEIFTDASHFNENELNELYEKYASWDFRYGESPRFDISFGKRFSWGHIDFGLTLKEAVIESVRIFSDAMDENFISELEKQLYSIKFTKTDLLAAISKMQIDDAQHEMKQSIMEFIENKEF
ncbi:MAG: lipoate--protein ligase [Clostridia bacterium]|nr:lipoate--protein ligase [Clostridia bacterium]